MESVRDTVIKKLIDTYRAYFNINLFEEDKKPLTAICEFYEHSEKYVLSRKAQLWAAECEEFIYLFDMERLTLEEYEKCRDFAYEDGMKRANIGPGHMYTFITPIFICDKCDEDAKKALMKCRIYKSFRFSLHGWMDFHTAVYEINNNKIFTNRNGKCVAKILKKVCNVSALDKAIKGVV